MSSSRSLNITTIKEPKSDEEQVYEESLLDTPSSISSSIYELCQCCGKPDCENLDYFTQLIKKLESDIQLAAEIGQSLLNKHENYVNESNQQRGLLEKQLEECQEKTQALELSLDNVENDKSEIIKERNKWLWEYQKKQKILNETISDLETTNEKCSQLANDLSIKEKELKSLRLFKFMMRHSESREEALASKLKDTSQELAICRKNELLLESKIKKLKTKHENLCNSHEKLLRDFEDRLKSALTVNNHRNSIHTITNNNDSNNNTNDLIVLIKELSLANTKLKLDLMNCNEQLSEAKGEIIALNQKMEDLNEPIQQDTLSSVIPVERLPIRSHTIPMPTISSSLPTSDTTINIHRHFNYYAKNTQGEYIQVIDGDNEKDIVLSPNKSTYFNIGDGTTTSTSKSPFLMLKEHVTQVLERLRGSDIRALNRRLKRAFEINELSSMSNSIIDNIIMELDTLESRFVWVKSENADFFPLLALLKDMLKELGVLRSTMNELQVEYVKKVMESEVRVEEEIRRKRQLKKQTTLPITSTTTGTLGPLYWITSMFTRSMELEKEDYVFGNDNRRQPIMTKSTSTSTSTCKSYRMNIDYEGIGSASIRPIPSEKDSKSTFSPSWQGGK